MPVTFKVASHPARALYIQKDRIPTTTEAVFEYGCEAQARRCKEMLQSSVENDDLATIGATNNGFVHTVLQAHGSHHHLRIRYVLSSVDVRSLSDCHIDQMTSGWLSSFSSTSSV